MLSKIKTMFLAAVAAVAAAFYAFAEKVYLWLARWMGTQGLVLSLNLYSQHTYDASLLLKAAGLVAASADGSLILDLGDGLFEGVAVVDATAIEVATGDETYQIIYEGSPDVAFTAGTLAALARLIVGAVAASSAPQGFADVPGRFTVPVRNERNGVLYRYMRIRTVVIGTIATGINYSTWLAKR
jgi:hypothetical protein